MKDPYDYQKDPAIAGPAEQYDKKYCKRAYDDILYGIEEPEFPFYDIDVLKTNHNYIKTFDEEQPAIQSILLFGSVIEYFFLSFHSLREMPEEKAIDYVKGLIIRLLERYKQRKNHVTNEDYYHWRDVTIDIIKDAFEAHPFSLSIMKEEKDNLWLLEQSLWTTQLIVESYIESATKDVFKKCVLYNFWGDKYDSLVANPHEQRSLTEDESNIGDVLNNKIFFGKWYKNTLIELVQAHKEGALSFHKYKESIRSELTYLFSDYTKRLRRNLIKDKAVVFTLTDYWEKTTISCMETQTYIAGQQYRLVDYHIYDVVHPTVFRSSQREQWEIINEFCGLCKRIVYADCELFKKRLESGELRYPWAEEFADIDCNFKKVYDVMFGVYFHTLSYAQFIDCLESADLSLLERYIIDTAGNKSVFRILVHMIGEHAPLWYAKALSSLTDSSGNHFSNKSIFRASFQYDKKYAKRFTSLLDDNEITVCTKKRNKLNEKN